MKKLLLLTAMVCCHLTSFGQKYFAAAQQGDAEAQYQMGECYFSGKNGVTEDYAKAVEWYRKAAEQGNPKAQIRLGLCYEFGYGIEENESTAKELYAKAIPNLQTLAEQGDIDAQLSMASCYFSWRRCDSRFCQGRGVVAQGSGARRCHCTNSLGFLL